MVGSYRLAQVCFTQWRYRRAIDLSQRGLAILSDESWRWASAVSPAVMLRQTLVWSLMVLGEIGEGITVLEATGRLAERIDHEFSRAVAYNTLG